MSGGQVVDGKAAVRIYASVTGELVTEGDARAAVLRYAVGDEVTKVDQETLKQAARPEDKQRHGPANKAR